MKKIISAILGTFLLFIVVYLGYKNHISPNLGYTVPSGLACTLAAPLGISALGYSIKKENTILKKLSKIPQIDNLIKEAETQEEKILRLEGERKELVKYIQFRAQKYAAKLKRILLRKMLNVFYMS